MAILFLVLQNDFQHSFYWFIHPSRVLKTSQMVASRHREMNLKLENFLLLGNFLVLKSLQAARVVGRGINDVT